MNICIFGMSAVSGHFGGRRAALGHALSAVARGANLAAIQRDGITLHSLGDTITARVCALKLLAEAMG